ncbi:MAG: NAD(P)/FAD-dependent oxidoreductase [Nitrospira sp.]|jgi:NADPH-dependent 2,4-dienoyl-CoA reductase/sulfur reductase-like enzyme|nr:NAD(P)/FAD-dependent oxidoreductase [Nitrospira sp.]
MDLTQYLLIGGGLASSQAAKQLRQLDAKASITLVTEEPHLPYDRPPLSKEFLRGETSKERLFFDEPSFFDAQQIDVKVGRAVVKLDIETHTATLAGGETLRFEKALIATGGRPVHLKIPGADAARVHYLRTLDDSMAIAASAKAGTEAVLIGAGFIGLEVAASLTQRGVHVTVVETASHIWPRFADEQLARVVQQYCAAKGVTFRTGEIVTGIQPYNQLATVLLKSGAVLPCDFICIGVGILPNVELAREAGLAVDNGILVDEYLQTSHLDLYAAGDVARYVDPLFGKRRRVEHWGHAEYSGQLAAQNMTGARRPYDLLTYVWSDIFDLHLEFAGDELGYDQVLLRGSLENLSCFILYLRQQRLTAYFAMNAGNKDLPTLQKLIKSQTDLSAKVAALQDSTVPFKTLLTS